MQIFGLTISRTVKQSGAATLVSHDRGNWWWPLIREPYTGAWQRNDAETAETLLTFHALYRCITLISQDIAKMRVKLVQRTTDDIWTEFESAAFTPVLRKPNRYQTRIQFMEDWIGSKLIHGNTYVLKGRDERNVVVSLHVLDPHRTKTLVAPDGAVFYEVQQDFLSGVTEQTLTVPASEVIHDRYKPLYHPLCGVSPISAAALSGALGLKIQQNSNTFFGNSSRPSGVLTAPGAISDDTAKRIKEHWENNYTGVNAGKIVVVSDGLKFEAMRETSTDSQLLEQLKLTAESVCTAFGVPPYMIGVGPPPNYNNIEALNQQYYSQCLQSLIESVELLLDEGLGLTAIEGKIYGTEFDLKGLLRMDTATKVDSWGKLVKASIASPNEARADFDLLPVKGGESPKGQQQDFSLAALAERDANEPFSKPAEPPPADDSDDEEIAEDEVRQLALLEFAKELQNARYS